MDPLIIAILMVIVLVMAILIGVHIGVALAFLSALGMWWMFGRWEAAITLIASTAFQSIRDYTFGVLPLFILMGLFANLSGASEDLYRVAYRFLGRVRGGLGIATVMANAVFAAITGSSVASAAVFSKISLPQMLRYGYQKRFALGTVAGSSVLGMLIPPSILLIVYGVLAEEAIGKLFIAGVIPGIILSAIYSVGVYILVTLRPAWGGVRPPIEKIGCIARIKDIGSTWGVLGLVFLVLGGIYLGWFTPTEAGAVGAFGAFILVILKRRFTWGGWWGTLIETGYTTASIFFLLIASMMYSRMLTLGGLVSSFSEAVIALPMPPIFVIALFLVLFLVLGAIIDAVSILLITMPLMLPVIEALGFDPIWFGIVSVVTIEIGILTPPFGLVVYAMKAALGEEASIEDIFIGSAPFWLMIAVLIAILVAFPVLSTWLPAQM